MARDSKFLGVPVVSTGVEPEISHSGENLKE
jgi:hypothetical protein